MLVRSYRTVSPLPVTDLAIDPSAVCSLLLPSSGRPDPALAGTLSCEAPTFLRFAIQQTRGHPTDSPSWLKSTGGSTREFPDTHTERGSSTYCEELSAGDEVVDERVEARCLEDQVRLHAFFARLADRERDVGE